jgi:hypothetical protein
MKRRPRSSHWQRRWRVWLCRTSCFRKLDIEEVSISGKEAQRVISDSGVRLRCCCGCGEGFCSGGLAPFMGRGGESCVRSCALALVVESVKREARVLMEPQANDNAEDSLLRRPRGSVLGFRVVAYLPNRG